MANLLGNKGAQLCEMRKIGLPIPPGFVISTQACREYFRNRKISGELIKEIEEALKKLEEETGKKFGNKENPLLLSVRSGAPVSMPGMMDTILNLGLNDEIIENMARKNKKFAYDIYKRFLQMFGSIVLGIDEKIFDEIIEKYGEENLEEIVREFKKIVMLPSPQKQLIMAIEAVFNSWYNERAINYRKIKNLPDDLGTGVVIQAMVFGNAGNDSLTGVIFTRNPSDGSKKLYGEFLVNAQGEDIVAGKKTPINIEKLKERFPKIYEELLEVAGKLERHYKDMQDVEFTVERGRLYILQTRNGKRTAKAAIKIAVDMAKEGIINKEEAIARIDASSLTRLLHKQIKGNGLRKIARGFPASPGAATGKACLSPDEAEKRGNKEDIILVRKETTPDDIHGVAKARGILTARGGITSHAAVVSRGLGIPCVVGCESIRIDEKEKAIRINGVAIREGEYITIDGTTGDVYVGRAELVDAELTDELKTLLQWADEIRNLKVYANADNGRDAKKALYFGADGIGLCRTEHMFLGRRLPIVRKALLDDEEKEKALKKLLEVQKKDFIEIFRVMKGKPVVIRLLDAPLHEFLGTKDEINPMLGFRGVRLAILKPHIYRMQARAIIEAAIEVKKEGYDVNPIIEIPIVSHVNEIKFIKKEIEDEIRKVFNEFGERVEYKYGAMLELPRACLTADEIAKEVDFISFGTNDLTQTTFGYSREDAEERFLHSYLERKILQDDPFAVLDEKGVGELMKIAVEKARKVKNLEIGICGEHGGEPKSIEFCQKIGLDSVSCSPYRVMIARLSAAQSSIRFKKEKSLSNDDK